MTYNDDTYHPISQSIPIADVEQQSQYAALQLECDQALAAHRDYLMYQRIHQSVARTNISTNSTAQPLYVQGIRKVPALRPGESLLLTPDTADSTTLQTANTTHMHRPMPIRMVPVILMVPYMPPLQDASHPYQDSQEGIFEMDL